MTKRAQRYLRQAHEELRDIELDLQAAGPIDAPFIEQKVTDIKRLLDQVVEAARPAPMTQDEYERTESQLAHAIDRANRSRTEAWTTEQADWAEQNYQRALARYEAFMNLPEHAEHNDQIESRS